MKNFFPILFLFLFFAGCVEYPATDWRSLYEKQAGEKIELTGYIGGALPYPQQIFRQGEQQGYLLDAQFGRQTTGIPLILQQQIDCSTKHVKVKGEIVKRGVQPMGSDFIELLDWQMIKVNNAECIP